MDHGVLDNSYYIGVHDWTYARRTATSTSLIDNAQARGRTASGHVV